MSLSRATSGDRRPRSGPEARRGDWRTWPAGLLVGLVKIYQRTLSPVLPIVMGPSCGCRFHPTCSHYAVEALRVHGAVRGTGLAIWRLLKCTPMHPGGFDAVPPPRRQCVRVTTRVPVRDALPFS